MGRKLYISDNQCFDGFELKKIILESTDMR